MQYTSYVVSVSNGDATVTGSNTLFVANVKAGDSFKVKNDPVIYQVASVTDNTHLELSAPFQGTTATGVQYQIGRDFTPIFGLYELSVGDQDWVQHLTVNVIRKLDSILGGYVNGDHMVFTDDVTGTRYTLRVSDGQLYKVEV